MLDNTAGAVHAAVAAVCPIQGVSIGNKDDKSTWRIDYAPEATRPQKDAAEAEVAKFRSDIAQSNAEALAKLPGIDQNSIRSMRAIIFDLYARIKDLEAGTVKTKPDPVEVAFLTANELAAQAERAKLADDTP